jgi:phosphate acetyltransferase
MQVRQSRLTPLIEKAKAIKGEFKVAIVNSITKSSLAGGIAAAEAGIIQPIFIGKLDVMQKIAAEMGKDLKNYECIDAADSKATIDIALDLIKTDKAATLMKGHLHTNELMRAVLSSANGLRTDRFVSHCMLMDIPAYHKLSILTDAAININPPLKIKKDIIQNSIDFALACGIIEPKVAILAAVEYIDENMPTTLEAAILCKMAERKEIVGGLVEGPLDFDVAVSKEAAAIKGLTSPVAGDADIFVAPNVETANILVKQMEYMALAETAGLVIGAKIPIILLSRSANEISRILSCALAKLMVYNKK